MRAFLTGLLLAVALCEAEDLNWRIDCWPEPDPTKDKCESRGCTFDRLPANTGPPQAPSCFMPREEMGYAATNKEPGLWTLKKNKGLANPFGADDIHTLRLKYEYIDNSVINIRIDDPNNKRYDVGELLDLPRNTQSSSSKLSVGIRDDTDPFSFFVKRDDGTVVFDTKPGGFVFADKFIQLAVQLPNGNMYGWGENIHPNLKHDFTRYTKWGMFARDEGPNSQELDTKNLYGVHPFYMIMENSGNAHGVLFLSSNAQDVVTVPANGYIYRTIGGIIDMYVFSGPTPAEVVQQYTAFVGRSFMPPHWALGFQLCRYGYKSLDDMKERVAAVRNYSIPFDVAYADIDYMQRNKDFTIGDNWAGFADYVKQLHAWDMRNILIFDPAIEVDYEPFQRAMDKGASFIEWERADEVPRDIQDQYPLVKNTKIMLSVVWPDKHVAFPDFLDPQTNTTEWWIEEFTNFHNQIGFDGAWIDMNEPAAFGTNEEHPLYFDDPDHPNLKPLSCPSSGPDSEWDVPPYKTQAVYHFGSKAYLAVKTVCMRAMSARSSIRQYNTHSLYGWSESRATALAVPAATGKRGVVISRSTFPSSGRFGGHWLGDNSATWEALRSAVIGVQEFNLFGIPYVGSDVCGFNGATTEELCLRWQQLGAFHSFYRNHNSEGEPAQDPAVWPSVALATKKANEFRYAYLPYLYSLHYKASMKGDTVVRPLFFEFPKDATTLTLAEQFMWGPSILVVPVLTKGATSVRGYVPATGGIFYTIYDQSNYGRKVPSGYNQFDAPTTVNAPALARSGSIIPRQPSSVTTVGVRKGNLNLLIVPGDDKDRTASGDLYFDDGDSIIKDISQSATQTTFGYTTTSTTSTLQITVLKVQGGANPQLEFIEVFDYPAAVTYNSFTLNGKTLSVNTQKSSFSAITKILKIVFSTPLNVSGALTITWNHGASLLTTNRVPS